MAAKSTALEALVHYDKSKVFHRQIQNVENDILNFHEKEYRDLFKIKPNKRNGHPKVANFKSKLTKTMPFWPKDCEELLEKSKKSKKRDEILEIEDTILFWKNMKDGDRSASYQGVNQTVSVREQKREDRRAQERQQEQEQR